MNGEARGSSVPRLSNALSSDAWADIGAAQIVGDSSCAPFRACSQPCAVSYLSSGARCVSSLLFHQVHDASRPCSPLRCARRGRGGCRTEGVGRRQGVHVGGPGGAGEEQVGLSLCRSRGGRACLTSGWAEAAVAFQPRGRACRACYKSSGTKSEAGVVAGTEGRSCGWRCRGLAVVPSGSLRRTSARALAWCGLQLSSTRKVKMAVFPLT